MNPLYVSFSDPQQNKGIFSKGNIIHLIKINFLKSKLSLGIWKNNPRPIELTSHYKSTTGILEVRNGEAN